MHNLIESMRKKDFECPWPQEVGAEAEEEEERKSGRAEERKSGRGRGEETQKKVDVGEDRGRCQPDARGVWAHQCGDHRPAAA